MRSRDGTALNLNLFKHRKCCGLKITPVLISAINTININIGINTNNKKMRESNFSRRQKHFGVFFDSQL